MLGGVQAIAPESLLLWGVINGEPLDIDYTLIYKGFNDAMNGQSEGAIINLLIAGFICWVFWSIMKWLFKRDEKQKIQTWQKIETIKPDYEYKGSGQQRQWMRIEAPAGFTFWLLNSQGEVVSDEIEERLLDLSAGGLSFYTNEILDIDKKLYMVLDLGKPPILKLSGRVARVQFSPEGVDKRYMIGVQFVGIRVGEQDRIIKYNLNNQRIVIEEQKKQEEICPTCSHFLPYNELGETEPCAHCLAELPELANLEAASTTAPKSNN